MIYRLAACLFLCVLSLSAFSQNSSNRCKYIKLSNQAFVLDSVTVVPGTIKFTGTAAGNLAFDYNPNTNKFQFKNIPKSQPDSVGNTVSDSVLVCYRVLPLNLALARYKRKLTLADSLRLPGIAPPTETLPQKLGGFVAQHYIAAGNIPKPMV